MDTPLPPPAERRPPGGVPRWLWPPPGARVERVLLLERGAGEASCFEVLEGEAPAAQHLNALRWLLHDHEVGARPSQAAWEARVLLEIARTQLPSGRVGHSYAIDGGPLGAPAGVAARGLLLRYATHVLGRA
ncbi:MAG: hypothetical protein ACKOSS_00710 [Planctomycetia bacterium]